jgi:hypothetical protein
MIVFMSILIIYNRNYRDISIRRTSRVFKFYPISLLFPHFFIILLPIKVLFSIIIIAQLFFILLFIIPIDLYFRFSNLLMMVNKLYKILSITINRLL